MRNRQPHDEDAEQAVLAAILLAPQENMPGVGGQLSAGHFYLERSRVVFRAMERVWVEQGAAKIDLLTLQDELDRSGDLETAGGIAGLAGLDLVLPDLGNLQSYVDIVRDRWIRRQLIAKATAAIAACAEGGDSSETLQSLQRDLIEIQAGLDAGEGYQHASAGVEGLRLNEPPGQLAGLPTGLESLDSRLLGLEPGNLYTIGGRPGMGKTALAITILVNLARRHIPCAMVSLEMTLPQLTARVVSQMSGVSHHAIKKRTLSANMREKVDQSIQELNELPLWIDATASQDAGTIAARAHALKSERGIQVLVIDYLGLVMGGKKESEALRLAEISRAAKLAAKDLDVSVLLLHQLNRECDKRSDPRPVLSDLRGTGALEQDSDAVIFCFREEIYRDDPDLQGIAELIVRKNRAGETCTVECIWIGERMQFLDAEAYRRQGSDFEKGRDRWPERP